MVSCDAPIELGTRTLAERLQDRRNFDDLEYRASEIGVNMPDQ